VAITPCRLLVMGREEFLFALQETPMVALDLLAAIEQRLRDLKICLAELS
jgi:CRP-like cAMP-binding protein